MSEVPCEWICNYFQFLLLRSSDCCILAGLSGIGMRDDRCYDAVDGSDRRHRKSEKSGYNTLSSWVSSQERAIPGSHRAIWCCHLCVCVKLCFTINVEICHTYPDFRPIWDLSRGMLF